VNIIIKAQRHSRFPRLKISIAVQAMALAVALGSSPRNAAAEAGTDQPVSLKAFMGYGYDSNVSVSQTNSSSGQADTLADLGLSASFKFFKTDSQSLDVGYDFSQTLHQKLNQFDIQTNAISMNASQNIGGSTAGLLYSFNFIRLGAHPFFDMQFVNPSYMMPLTSQIFFRSSVIYINECYHTDKSRNADHIQPDVQLFYFFPGSKTFVTVSANYQREQTKGPEFTYSGYGLRADMTLPLQLLAIDAKLKAGYEWTSRNYDNITASLGARRYDRLGAFKLSSEFPVTKKLSLEVQGQYIGRNSNLASANIDESTVEAGLSYRY